MQLLITTRVKQEETAVTDLCVYPALSAAKHLDGLLNGATNHGEKFWLRPAASGHRLDRLGRDLLDPDRAVDTSPATVVYVAGLAWVTAGIGIFGYLYRLRRELGIPVQSLFPERD